MFSGKSSELIRRVNRYRIAGYNVQVYKPLMDNRYGTDIIASHDNEKLKAIAIRSVEDILSTLEEKQTLLQLMKFSFLMKEYSTLQMKLQARGKYSLLRGLILISGGSLFLFEFKKDNCRAYCAG